MFSVFTLEKVENVSKTVNRKMLKTVNKKR